MDSDSLTASNTTTPDRTQPKSTILPDTTLSFHIMEPPDAKFKFSRHFFMMKSEPVKARVATTSRHADRRVLSQ
ncbi:hypothetical protein C8Q74DRAFT_301217 [Fomes fomentarius]|nr:hypothetical protein C8Q74DRAFT_301217 [Fomes fomentarius]